MWRVGARPTPEQYTCCDDAKRKRSPGFCGCIMLCIARMQLAATQELAARWRLFSVIIDHTCNARTVSRASLFNVLTYFPVESPARLVKYGGSKRRPVGSNSRDKVASALEATEKTQALFVQLAIPSTLGVGGSCRHGRAVEFPGASDGCPTFQADRRAMRRARGG